MAAILSRPQFKLMKQWDLNTYKVENKYTPMMQAHR